MVRSPSRTSRAVRFFFTFTRAIRLTSCLTLTATAEQLFPGGKADTDDPVVAASVSEPAIGSGEILVSLARSSMLQCVSIVPGVKSELKCSFKPTPRGGSYVTAPGMCAWSETTRGIVYYASRATGGRVVQFDALKSEVVCIVDVGTGR